MSESRTVEVTVNGVRYSREVEPRMLLSDFLRTELGLTGTHVGCEHGVCGACTIQLDGEPVRSCLMLAVQANGASLRTVEGLAPGPEELHPIQEAFREEHGLAVRILHAGHPDDGRGLPARQPEADAGSDPPRNFGPSLPVHGIRRHRPVDRARRCSVRIPAGTGLKTGAAAEAARGKEERRWSRTSRSCATSSVTRTSSGSCSLPINPPFRN